MYNDTLYFCDNCGDLSGIEKIISEHNYTCLYCNGKLVPTLCTNGEMIILSKYNKIYNLEYDTTPSLAETLLKHPINHDLFYQTIQKRHELSKQRVREAGEHISKKIQENKPKCPTCNSTKVRPISASKRWLTTGLFGLASSNVGKTYECLNCKYKW